MATFRFSFYDSDVHRASFALPQFVKKVSVEIEICEIACALSRLFNEQTKEGDICGDF